MPMKEASQITTLKNLLIARQKALLREGGWAGEGGCARARVKVDEGEGGRRKVDSLEKASSITGVFCEASVLSHPG